VEWFARDFDHEDYFDIYRGKVREALEEGPALAAYLELPPGSLVLDLPCGWGRLRPFLTKHGYAVTGGDLSALNLRRHAKEQPGPLARLDLRALPFRDQCADGVLCAYTSWGYFRTLDENLAQIREFARVLRPGGILILDLVGRDATAGAIASVEHRWFEVNADGVEYRERVRWSPDRTRVVTDRAYNGRRFRHDIWLPRDAEVRTALAGSGFDLDRAWGGYHNEAWDSCSERWIYRARRRRES
jgi:SAM-dependent methyltransferase